MTNKSNSHLARYAVVSNYGFEGQIAWFVSKGDAIDFIVDGLKGDANYYSIEEVD